jgi:hypothetical protein
MPRAARLSAPAPRCPSDNERRAWPGVARVERSRFTPDAAVRAVPSRLLLLCLLLRSSWLTVEGGRQIGAAGLLHRRGGRAALAVSVSVAVGVPKQHGESIRWALLLLARICQRGPPGSSGTRMAARRRAGSTQTGRALPATQRRPGGERDRDRVHRRATVHSGSSAAHRCP